MVTDSEVNILFEDSLGITPESVDFVKQGMEECAIVKANGDDYVIKIHNSDVYSNTGMFLAGPELMGRLPDLIPSPEIYSVEDGIDSLIGTPYYIMDFVEGFHFGIGEEKKDKTFHESIIEQSATILSELNKIELELSGVGWLEATYTNELEIGGGATTMEMFIRHQLNGEYVPSIKQEYSESGRFSESVPVIEKIAEEIISTGVECQTVGVCHRDYKYDNLIVEYQEKPIQGVIDWEIPMYVDPLFNVVKAEWSLIDEGRIFGDISESRGRELRNIFREVYGDYMDSGNSLEKDSVAWRELVYRFLFILEAINGFTWWFDDFSEDERTVAAEFYRSELETIAAGVGVE